MATLVKNFKVKSGLVVEGSTGTIGGYDILTKKDADKNYIINLIGGAATPDNDADTVVLRDENGSFAAEVITADGGFVGSLTGNVTGDVTGDLTGNADTATALETARTIELTGDVTGSVSFDGTGDVEISATIDGSFATDTEVATAKSEAISAAATDATTKADAAQTAAEEFATAADTTLYGTVTANIATAKTAAEAFATAADTTLYGTVTGDIATAKQEAIEAAAEDATTKANTAEANAESYVDSLIGDNTVDGTSGNTVKARIDSAVAGLVGSAPELLDTLQELALALENDPDVIADLRDIAAGKQDTLTAGANIDITGATISVTGLDTDDVAEGTNKYFTDARAVTANTGLWDTIGAAEDALQDAKDYADALDTDDIDEGATNLYFTNSRALSATAAAYDASGSAATAEQNAKTYADGLVADLETVVEDLTTDEVGEGLNNLYYTPTRAKIDAAALLTGATKTNIQITGDESGLTITAENGVADSDTDDLREGDNNLYFTDERAVDALQGTDSMFTTVDINEVALQVAATTGEIATAGVQTAYAWAKADYRSAEFLVKVAYGTHTEISKVLLTLDTTDNIAITEYGIVGTNGSASTISAAIVDDEVELQVTTANNNSTITVVGTLLA